MSLVRRVFAWWSSLYVIAERPHLEGTAEHLVRPPKK